MTWIYLQAKDVWLFRDGKPFSSGEDHSARSMFPPTPLTVQGAMRAKISMSLGVSLQDYHAGETDKAKEARYYIGPPSKNAQTGEFEMQGPFVAMCINDTVYQLLPAPFDLYKFDEENTKNNDSQDNLKEHITGQTKKMFQIPALKDAILSDFADGQPMLEALESYENLGGYWLTAEAFNNYLDGTVPDKSQFLKKKDIPQNNDYTTLRSLKELHKDGIQLFPNGAIYRTEGRFGVETNAHTSYREEGQLYQAQFIRMSDEAGLLINVENIPDNYLTGSLTLGGEQRQAIAEKPAKTETVRQNPNTVTGKFKIILLTPAYFDDGWQPRNGFSELFGRNDIEFVSAALDRPKRIGGWSNNKNGGARPMHNYVPPGSIYYFDAGEATVELPSAFTQTPHTIDDATKIGFGQFAVTDWD